MAPLWSPGRRTVWSTWATWAYWATWLLGAERVQRIGTSASLIAAAVYVAAIAVFEAFAATTGVIERRYAPELMALILAGPLGFYGLQRSGWSQRLREPSMTLAQTLYAVLVLTLSYPVNGSVRGLNLMLLALLPVFGIGALYPRGIRWLGAVSLLSIGTMMGWLAYFRPAHFNPKLELVHFVLAAAAIPAIAHLAAEVSGLRWKQRRQREALKAALASLERLATRDELTGLLNRSPMQVQLTQEAQRAMRQDAPLCICLMDIDHFKRVNDQHGHAIGDQVLQRFALRCAAALRDIDVLARWGGEEFLLLLPSTSLAAGSDVLARLRSAQRQSDDTGNGLLPSVSFSAGLAQHLPADDVQATIARADAALYRAKASGRDCVVLATPGPAASADPATQGPRTGS
jgi:diguanylate cyclase (GGDEF)-like protein